MFTGQLSSGRGSRRRAAAGAAAFIALITMLSACDTSSSGQSTAAIDQQSAAANRAAAVRNRALVARRRAAAARRRARTATTTTTTRVATTPTTIVTTSITSSGALVAIQTTVDALNVAFGKSVSDGVMDSTVANHWVGYGVYSGNECVSFEMARGQGVVAEHLNIHPETLRATPGWVDPVIGRVPQGRIFQLAIDETQTLVTTGQQRGRTLWIHVTVQSDGNARLFLRCR